MFSKVRMRCAVVVLALGSLGAYAGSESIDAKLEVMGAPKYIKVTALSAQVANQLLVLNLDVANQDNQDSEAFYRIRWLDEAGDSVWQPEGWKPLLLHGDQKIHLRLVAPTPKARDFRVELSATDNSPN